MCGLGGLLLWEFYINSIFRKLLLCSALTLTTVYITDTTVLYYNIDVWQTWRTKLWNELALPFWWNCEPSPSTGGCSAPGCNGRRFLCHRSPGWTVWRAPTKTHSEIAVKSNLSMAWVFVAHHTGQDRVWPKYVKELHNTTCLSVAFTHPLCRLSQHSLDCLDTMQSHPMGQTGPAAGASGTPVTRLV